MAKPTLPEFPPALYVTNDSSLYGPELCDPDAMQDQAIIGVYALKEIRRVSRQVRLEPLEEGAQV